VPVATASPRLVHCGLSGSGRFAKYAEIALSAPEVEIVAFTAYSCSIVIYA